MSMSLRRVGIVLVATSLVAACGSSDDGGETSNADPIAELFGWNVDQSPAERRAEQLALEEAVQTCMAAEGFEYTPVDYEAQFGGLNGDDEELVTDPNAFGEKYGYGVVRNYEQYEEPFLLGEADEEEFYSDPNSDYVNSLSQAEQEDYYTLLYGDQSAFEEPMDTIGVDGEDDGAVEFEPPPIEEQGCYGKAQLEVVGERPFEVDPEIQNRLEDFFTQMQDDPEIEAAEQDWLTCINDETGGLESPVEGFEIVGPDSMYQYVDFLKSAAQGYEIVDYEQDDQGGSGYGSEGEPEPIPADELEELRARELELWKIDQQCQEDSKFEEIRLGIEQRLVDDLRAEFPDLEAGDG